MRTHTREREQAQRKVNKRARKTVKVAWTLIGEYKCEKAKKQGKLVKGLERMQEFKFKRTPFFRQR
jgi:hypothetical protein